MAPQPKSMPLETLDELLTYNALTGLLYWKERCESRFSSSRAAKSWNTRWAGTEAIRYVSVRGYKYGAILSQNFTAHRIAFAMHHRRWPSLIDHVNGDKTDNRICNLREVTQSENSKNVALRPANVSGAHGVTWDAIRERWFAKITIDGKQKALGRFRSLQDAIHARRAAEEVTGGALYSGRKDFA